MPGRRLGKSASVPRFLCFILWCAVLVGCVHSFLPFSRSRPLFPFIEEHEITGFHSDYYVSSWRPDGAALVLNSNTSGMWDLWTMNLDGTNIDQLARDPSSRYSNYMATWSPDGRWLLFSSDRAHRVWPNLWLLDLEQSHPPEQLTPADGKYFFPIWSPDGTQIIYIYLPTGPPYFELRVMSFPDRTIRVLNTNGIAFSPPAWSPDGTRIAFASDRTGNPEIWLLTLSTGELRQLTHDPATDTQPSWSPDGRYIAFTSNRSGNADIWVMDVSAIGTASASAEPPLQQLTHHPAIDHYPRWSPDGKRIAFTSNRSGREAPWLIELQP
jgi:Tol biopolymer transport system component